MFDWENAIALHAMQGIGPHLVARGIHVGWVFLMPLPTPHSSAKSRLQAFSPIISRVVRSICCLSQDGFDK